MDKIRKKQTNKIKIRKNITKKDKISKNSLIEK